ncbi:MAG TPA: neutral zinc metallopeptidase [Dehalococcoidia bacterium]|nr:neutral zinc metallopeptidase [Dehalococcoidia bacterium]
MTKIVLILSFAALAFIGCGSIDLGRDEAEPSSQAPGGAASACPSGSLEGCFGFDEMDRYLEAVLPMVQQFFRERRPGLPEPQDVVYIRRGETLLQPCFDPSGRPGLATSASFEYCAANQTIYIGQDLLWEFYRGAGDAAPAIALAHEWGHHVQVMLRVPPPQTASQSVRFENQADCISGAWARYADEKGWLETEDDLQDVETLIAAIGAREGSGRDHGTAQERADAFRAGYERGLRACNAFFPQTPIA